MGYRSEISILVTLPKRVSAQKIINEFKKAWGEDFNDYFSTDKKCVANCVYIGTKEDLKWYEGIFGYEEVNRFMDIVYHWKDHFKSGGIHYIRLGEDFSDTEEIVNGEVEEYLQVNRIVELP